MTRFYQFSIRKLGIVLASVMASAGGLGLMAPLPSFAQTTFELRSTLAPAENEHRFEGVGGQTVSISMSSEEFDTFLVLLGPDGEEIAMNDDFGRTLNSNIVMTLPEDGTYTVIAKAFSGHGDYVVSVRIATALEIALSEAQNASFEGDFQRAIAAYTEAIALDPNQIGAYLGRAEAYFGAAYDRLGNDFMGPEDLSDEEREAVASDYESAADLYESQGEFEIAASLREQALYIRTGELPLQPGIDQ